MSDNPSLALRGFVLKAVISACSVISRAGSRVSKVVNTGLSQCPHIFGDQWEVKFAEAEGVYIWGFSLMGLWDN